MVFRYMRPRSVSFGGRTTSASTRTDGDSENVSVTTGTFGGPPSGSTGQPGAGPGGTAGGGVAGVARTQRFDVAAAADDSPTRGLAGGSSGVRWHASARRTDAAAATQA